MIGWKDLANLRVFNTLRFKKDAVMVTENADGTESRLSVAELAALNDLVAADLQKIDGITNGTPANSKALVLNASLGIGAFRETGRNLRTQAAAAAKTTSVTLTAAEIIAGLLTGNQGAAGAATYTLPLGTDIETALIASFPGLANDDSFDFSIINISTVAAEIITVATNTGLTLVGDLTIAPVIAGDQSSGTFRCRRTAANTYTVYRR